MIAIGNERFRGSNGFPMAQEARPEVVVLTGFAVSISPEVFSNKMQGKNGRGVRNGVSEAEIPAQAGVFERWSKPSPPKPVSVDQAGLRIDKNRVGIFRNETGLLCQSVPSRAVVGVLAGDPFSSCFLQAGIQGGHKALIGRKAYEAKPWVGKFLHAFRSAVRRSIIDYQQLVRRVPVPDHIYRFAAKLVRKTRPKGDSAPAWLKPLVSWGAGPRAVQNLVLGAKSRAAISGSYMVRLEDVEAVAAPVLTHRLITTFAAQAEGIDAKQIVARLVKETIEEQVG